MSRIVGSSPESSRAAAERLGADVATDTVGAAARRRRRRRRPRLHAQRHPRPAGAGGDRRRQARGLREAAGGRPGRGRGAGPRWPPTAGVTATVPFVYRFYPTVREARARVADGTHRSGPAAARLLPAGLARRGRPTTTGGSTPRPAAPSRAFADIGVHWCDLVEFVSGHRITRLAARTVIAVPERGGRPVETEDAAVVLFETDRGAIGNLTVSQVSQGRKNRLWFSVDGADESLCFDQENPDVAVDRRPRGQPAAAARHQRAPGRRPLHRRPGRPPAGLPGLLRRLRRRHVRRAGRRCARRPADLRRRPARRPDHPAVLESSRQPAGSRSQRDPVPAAPTSPDREDSTSHDPNIPRRRRRRHRRQRPCGAAYARILSEQCPGRDRSPPSRSGRCWPTRPACTSRTSSTTRSGPRAQRRSEGPAPLGADTPTDTMEGYADAAPRLVRPGTFLLADGYQQPGEDGLPGAAMSSNVGGMGAHWTGACPRPGDSERIGFLPDLDELLAEGERLLNVDAHAFDDAPFAGEVRKRLSDALDDGRAEDRRVGADAAGGRSGSDDGRVTWSGSDVVFGDVTRANPNFTLVPEALVTEVLVSGRPGHRGPGARPADRRTSTSCGPASSSSPPTRCARRSCCGPPVSGRAALGRYLNDQPQTVFAVRLRDVEHRAGGGGRPARRAGDRAAERGQLGARTPTTSPFHGQVMQLDASPVPLADDDVPTPGTIVGLGWFCAKDLQESDRVEFDAGRDRRLRHAGDADPLPAHRARPRLDRAPRGRPSAVAAAARRAARTTRAAHLPARRVAALPGHRPDGRGPTTAPRSARPTSRGLGRRRASTSPATASSRPPIACNPTLTSVALAVAGARDIAPRSPRGEVTMLDSHVIQGRGFRNVARGRPGHRLPVPAAQPQLPRCRGQPARRHRRRRRRRAGPRARAAVDPAGPHVHPRRAARARPTSAGSSTSPPPSPCRKPGGLSVGRARLEVVVYLRRSVLPAGGLPHAVHRRRARASSCRRAPGRRPAVRRLHLQLHQRHLHLDDAGGRVRRHRRPRRHRHRDPRRGQHPELPDADRGVDRRVARAAASSTG